MLLKIDFLSLQDHSYLTGDDNCYFIREYTTEGFAIPDNQLVYNFKCPADHHNSGRLYYKRQAIQTANREIREALQPLETLADTVFIPLPPSKLPNSPAYDVRVRDSLREAERVLGVRVIEVLSAKTERLAAHETSSRPSVDELAANLSVDSLEWVGAKYVVIFDDVLVTGAQFKAAEKVLRGHDPKANILGLFWVRRTFP